MTDKEVWDSLIRWLAKEYPSRTVIKAYQSGARPALPYLSVNFIDRRELSENNLPVTECSETDAPYRTPHLEIEWQFSIHAYGDNASDLLRPLVSRAHVFNLVNPLNRRLLVHDVGSIANFPELINNKWEQRANCKLFIHGVSTDSMLHDPVEQAQTTFTRG